MTKSHRLKVSIVRKAETDVISDGENGTFLLEWINPNTQVLECKEEGSPRRSGGQGDILTGSIAAFLSWGKLFTSDSRYELIVDSKV